MIDFVNQEPLHCTTPTNAKHLFKIDARFDNNIVVYDRANY